MNDTAQMRYLGIDYGTRVMGLAISDEKGSFAFPKGVVENNSKSFERLAQIIRDERVGAIVVGDTRAYSGGENPITKESDAFAAALQARVKIPLHRAREAWSSHEAARFAPMDKKHDDSAAAAIILQRFLDQKK